LSAYPRTLGDGENYLERNYELLHGEFPTEVTDLVLVIGRRGRLTVHVLEQLGFDTDRDSISFDEILSTELKLINNNDFYEELSGNFEITPENLEEILEMYPMARMMIPSDTGIEETIEILNSIMADMSDDENPMSRLFAPGSDYQTMWDSENSIDLRITGIVRQSGDSSIGLLSNGLAYSDDLCELVIEHALDSDIVNAQLGQEESVFPGLPGANEGIPRDMMLSILGADTVPASIMLYPASFEKKDLLLEYLDSWNEGKDCTCDDDNHDEICGQIIYTDMAGMLLGFMSEIISAVTIVLIAFAAISLIVSLIMIAIITYISVLERTKEIGILRALGARKKDITRVFDAETFIIGVCSGTIGVLIAWLLTFPANIIIDNMTNLPNVARLNILHVVALVILSTTLTVLGGHLPARMASKRDAVEALRSE
jgi:putative ABC transport system permease protein